ncbi:MAG: hypothetical protein WCK26_01120 [Candidatus Saccharibacteria bacterium]
MKKLFKKVNKKNLQELRQELSRAHLIVALLSIAIISLLSLGATNPVSFDPTLSAVCAVLLIVVTIISLSMSINLSRKK